MNDQAASATSDGSATAPRAADGLARLLLITGMSGAGKTATLKALEDMGYEAVDNLPLSLLADLIGPLNSTHGAFAIGVDIRTRDFGVDPMLRQIESLVARPDLDVRLVFLDCEDEILRQRYTETRRRHPMSVERREADGATRDRRVTDGITHERQLLVPLRDRADLVIDTSQISLNELRQVLSGHFALDAETPFSISVISFSYRHGVPREADLVFDVRFLRNPHYAAELRPLTGRDDAVGRFIAADSGFAQFFTGLTGLLDPLFPRFRAEGKSYLTIAIGCTGGQHRSVYVAERLAAWLETIGERPTVQHREIRQSAPVTA